MKNKENHDMDTFFLAFCGQQIVVTIDKDTSITSSSEHGTVTETYPMSFEGILLDYDLEYLYLGQTPNEISEAVPISRRVHIKLNDETKMINELLKQMSGPKNEGEIN